MKKLIVIAAIAALTLAVAPVALGASAKAQAGTNSGKVVFTANGKVTEVNPTDGAFSMRVWSGSRVRKERGHDIVIHVTDTTKIWRVAMGRSTPVALADLKIGERVWTKGTFTTGNEGRTYTAARVKLTATWPFMAKGVVDTVDAAGNSLTVKITRSMRAMRSPVDEVVAFVTVESTVVKKRDAAGRYHLITLADVKEGDKVLISGRVDNREPTDMQYIAKRLLVR